MLGFARMVLRCGRKRTTAALRLRRSAPLYWTPISTTSTFRWFGKERAGGRSVTSRASFPNSEPYSAKRMFAVPNIVSALLPKADISKNRFTRCALTKAVGQHQLIGWDGEERHEFAAERQFAKQLDRFREAPTGVICRPDLALDHLHLFPERTLEKRGGYFHAALEHGAVFDPLPNLCAGDLGGRRVFHEIVDRHRAAPAQPGIDILYADPDIEAHTRFGLGPFVNLQQVVAQHAHM